MFHRALTSSLRSGPIPSGPIRSGTIHSRTIRYGAPLIALLLFLAACDTAPHASPDAPSPPAATDAAWNGKHPGPSPETMGICHRGADGTFQKQSVPRAAVTAHLRHGDALPGTHSLDENCDPIPVTCPCFTSPKLPSYAFTTDLDGMLVLNEYADTETSASLFYAIQRTNGDLMSVETDVTESTCAIWGAPQAEPNPYSPAFDLTISITPEEAPVCRQDLRAFSEQLDQDLPDWNDSFGKQHPPQALAQAIEILQHEISTWRSSAHPTRSDPTAPSAVRKALNTVEGALSN